DGMGNLRVNKQGVRLEGISEFLLPLYVKEIQSRKDSPLILQSDRNVTVNARNELGQLTGQLIVGPQAVEAQCKRFEVHSSDGGKVLFSADKDEVSIGAGKLRVAERENELTVGGVLCNLILTHQCTFCRLESPTRTLTMEAPKGVEISADAGDFKATCRKEMQLQSTEGEFTRHCGLLRYITAAVRGYKCSPESKNEHLQETRLHFFNVVVITERRRLPVASKQVQHTSWSKVVLCKFLLVRCI
ncbi:UNVERIFIED_CONTAM: hypothetical protein FKN15_041697, partial [Acipenser sinensis]